MPKHNNSEFSADHDPDTPNEEKANLPARRTDLIELIRGPLSAQIERARLEILEKIGKIDDSTEMIAGQMRRELDD